MTPRPERPVPVPSEAAKVRATDCPCGCEGRYDDHDERGWGPWPCPICDDDSDVDLGKPCSDRAGK